MPITKDDLVKAVQNLNKLTRDREIRWKNCTPSKSALFGAGIHVRQAYCAEFQKKTLRITRESSGTILTGDSKKYLLEIVEPSGGAVLYQFPDVQGISDLFESISFQQADVENIIRGLADR